MTKKMTQAEQVLELHLQGLSREEIASKIKLSRGAVTQYIYRFRGNGKLPTLKNTRLDGAMKFSQTLHHLTLDQRAWVRAQLSPDQPLSLFVLSLITDAFFEETGGTV